MIQTILHELSCEIFKNKALRKIPSVADESCFQISFTQKFQREVTLLEKTVCVDMSYVLKLFV